MRAALLIILLFTAKANATLYYVSNNGNDNNTGTSICDPWLTIDKINKYRFFTSGDIILFKCGDSWNERLIIPTSNITFDCYGSGDKPLITGFQKLSGFLSNGNIWTTTANNAVKVLTTVMINGAFAYKSRYPNSTYITPIGPFVNSYIKTTIPNANNYVGCEIVVRTTQWVIDVRKITSQYSGIFYLSKNLTYAPTYGGRGIFFQNRIDLIDSIGEFSYDSSNKILSVYSIDTPTVQISSIDTLVNINHKNNITFNNISFTGANMYTFKIDTSHNITIKNCSINYAGSFGIYASKSRDIIIGNNSIQNCYNSGILLGSEFVGRLGIITDTCKRSTVINNSIKNIGKVAGMAANGLYNGDGELTHGAIWISGDSALIKNNVIYSIGGIPIRFIGRYDSICYNYINSFQFIKVDGGAIRTFQGSNLSPSYNNRSIIYRNIIGNGIGTKGATDGIINNNIAPGIYMDLYSNGITIKENTVFNCLGGALFQIGDSNIVIRGNNFEDSIDHVSLIYSGVKNIFLRNNVFYQRHKSRWIAYSYPLTQNSDSNYFIKPSAPTSVFIQYNGKNYTFPYPYVDSTGWEMNTKIAPYGVTGTGKLYINPTLKDSIINVNGTFIDARGNMVTNSFTLEPFTSITLFPYQIPIAKINKR